MAKKEAAQARPIIKHDELGAAWQAEANAAWEDAEERAVEIDDPEQPTIVFYDPPPLPDFNEGKPEHVTRPLLGRYIEDRETNVVHDCHRATSTCRVDGIKNGTFYHFGYEVPEGLTLHTCVEVEQPV